MKVWKRLHHILVKLVYPLLFQLAVSENQMLSLLLVIALCYSMILHSAISSSHPFSQVCLLLLISQCSSTSPIVSLSRLIDLTKLCFYRAHFFASVKMATLESFARNSMPAITDLVATTAPALTLDRGVKDATSHAPALQVCVCVCV